MLTGLTKTVLETALDAEMAEQLVKTSTTRAMTLYFEADDKDDLRKVGYSKERRVDRQVVVGLLVDREGFPLEVGCFEGNRAECDTRSHAVSGSRGWRPSPHP